VNKFLVDDKGSTLVAVFGLPPLAHEDDATRAVLAALAVCVQVRDTLTAFGDQAVSRTLTAPQQVHAFGDQSRGQHASVGLTTGHAFCGVVGSQGNRREYTVLGDVVNLSARLMQVLC
jgi:adenylate cyclase 10